MSNVAQGRVKLVTQLTTLAAALLGIAHLLGSPFNNAE